MQDQGAVSFKVADLAQGCHFAGLDKMACHEFVVLRLWPS